MRRLAFVFLFYLFILFMQMTARISCLTQNRKSFTMHLWKPPASIEFYTVL